MIYVYDVVFTFIITMSVLSQQTASQTEFQDAMAYLNVQSNASSGCDTYMPMELISGETHETLISVSNKQFLHPGNFCFNGDHYLLIRGKVMGSLLAPTFTKFRC